MFQIQQRFQKLLSRYFFTRPQSYSVNYLVKVSNLSLKKNALQVILPIPSHFPYQKIENTPVFTPKEDFIGLDQKLKNQYVIWKTVLLPKKTEIFSQKFSVKVLPRKTTFNQKFYLKDYQNLKNSPEYQLFIRADKFLEAKSPKIKNLVHQIIGQEKKINQISKRLYDYVRNHLNYGQPIKGLYSATSALELEMVDCGGFASLLGALYLSVGIPARIISGYWLGYQNNRMHAWLEFLLPDRRWIAVDPTVEHLNLRKRSQKLGGFGFTGSDRLVLSFGSDLEINLPNKKISVDILQNPIVISQLGQSSIEIKHQLISRRYV